MRYLPENQPLLLPHFPDLKLLKTSTGWEIEACPGWLENLLGLTTAEADEKISFEKLQQHIPGILEILDQVYNSRDPIKGFQTTMYDQYQGKTDISVDAEIGSGERNPVLINIQPVSKIPSQPHLEHQTASFYGMVGKSERILQVFNKIRLYAVVDAPILIFGETGTGKEKVAEGIHALSKRAKAPFVAVNCSAISETLFESELFGHEKGSFTGAIKSHRGRFERADKGTLFLDEIGDLPGSVQTKMLRVLETSSFERVGGEHRLCVDVRIVAATNKNLELEISRNLFRSDLFYRLSALQIFLPPLRERGKDIPLLVNHFIGDLNQKYGRNVYCLSPEALHLLQQYQWPGNIRELRNLMERLFAENHADVIGIKALREWYEERVRAANDLKYDPNVTHLPYRNVIELGMQNEATKPGLSKDVSLPGSPRGRIELTLERLKAAFKQAQGNLTQVASILGVHKATVYRFMKKHQLNRENLRLVFMTFALPPVFVFFF